MTKEQLLAELADWIARSQHESKLAFAAGDLWAGLVWGAKVEPLSRAAKMVADIGYETGDDRLAIWETEMNAIVTRLDPQGLLRLALGHRVECSADVFRGYYEQALRAFGEMAYRAGYSFCVIDTLRRKIEAPIPKISAEVKRFGF